MVVNGTRVQIDAVSSIGELLASLGLHGKRIAIERNGHIVPRSEYDRTRIAAEDRIEIVVAVGGG
jgi:sulfur carrier protein